MKIINLPAGLVLLATYGFSGLLEAADWTASGGVVITHQRTRDIRHETLASADLIFSRRNDSHEWLVHLEGTTTPDSRSIARALPEVNSDAGTALDKNDRGRFQLSEAYYRHTAGDNRIITAGLLDVSGFFEQSRIASDESTQFLGAFFIGNPTIEFPDYTLGLVYEQPWRSGLVLRAAITSSNGIADNSERSYSQLLSVRKKEKGEFAIASVSWKSEAHLLRVGTWTNTADHSAIDGSGRGHRNYGVYALAGHTEGRHAFNLRLGLANEKVSLASGFASLGYQYKLARHVLGAGAARAYLSADEANRNLGDTTQYEIYWRYALSKGFFLTTDMQQIVNSDFGRPVLTRNRSISVYGLRLSYIFDRAL